MAGRFIAIGDVHGCYQELGDLLKVVNPDPQDQILFLGDLVNRGPDSHRCLELLRVFRARSLLGNHELRLLRHRLTGESDMLRETDRITLRQLKPEDWEVMSQMPLYHHEPKYNILFVHGGFLPGKPWQSQPASIVTNLQVLGPSPDKLRRSDAPDAPFWAESWKGPEFVVYGHTPSQEVIRHPHSLGIDTGCVAGGKLTAYILPEKKLVQVPARKVYSPNQSIKR